MDMIQNFTDIELQNEARPAAIYYTKGNKNPSRRQQKRQMLLTFINHSGYKREFRRNTAPNKPLLIRVLLSIIS
ncbi:MAG: hypothetical protein K9G49_16790 [Taibaiella sp.]|nr:hypothetical protein [Taibaiella sp.]